MAKLVSGLAARLGDYEKDLIKDIKEPNINKSLISKNGKLEADVVIVGGGGAGMTAAVAAAEKGATVIVLEKRGFTGGNSAIADGPMAAESPAQKRDGIICRKDDIFKQAMDWAHWTTNPRLVRAYINKSSDTIRWFEEKGAFFKCTAHATNEWPLTWHITQGKGAQLMRILAKECKTLGVEVLTRTPVKRILTGKKGNVIGVLAEREGKELEIKAGSVIIAAGGFMGNKKLLKKYCPNYRDNMPLCGLPHMGDGLVMATEIGAATEGLGLFLGGPFGGCNWSIKLDAEAVSEPQLFPIGGILHESSNLVWVNKNGRRFVDESIGDYTSSFEIIRAIFRQPESTYYILFDTSIVQMVTKQGKSTKERKGSSDTEQFAELIGLESGLLRKAKENTDYFKMANSWEELGDWMGADPKVLAAEMNDYNSFCDHGHDEIFAKDRTNLLPLRTAPFYAVKSYVNAANTIGGIKINENMEVISKEETPIPGFYAAGEGSGGWMSDTYGISGSAFSFALNSGRIAGEEATNYALVKTK